MDVIEAHGARIPVLGFGTMTLKDGNTLRVEACAFSRFFCSGNDWTRVVKSDEATSRDQKAAPKS